MLATNTSSLSVTEMAAGLQHPERVVGFHFFNPVAVMPLLEIITAERTDDASLATAFALAKPLKKGPILVKDATGFVFNRLLLRFMGEILAAIDEGTPADVADGALEPARPADEPADAGAADRSGGRPARAETLHDSFGDRFPVSENLRRIVDAGHRTLLSWDDQGRQILDPEIAAILVQGDSAVHRGAGAGARAARAGARRPG